MATRPTNNDYVEYKGVKFSYLYENPDYGHVAGVDEFLFQDPADMKDGPTPPATKEKMEAVRTKMKMRNGQPLNPVVGDNAFFNDPQRNKDEATLLSWLAQAPAVKGWDKKINTLISQMERQGWYKRGSNALPEGAAGIVCNYYYQLRERRDLCWIFSFPLVRGAKYQAQIKYGESK